jgi:drug/metabolite transporter (DMT)-like permease
VVAVVSLSLLAALLFASASAIQQRVAADEGIRDRPLALVRRLLRRRRWLGGWAVNVIGFFTQTAALRLGSVAIVQPLLTAQLLFAVPLGTIGTPLRPSRRDWVGAVAVCAGLAVFLQLRGAASLHDTHPDRTVLLESLPVAAAFVLALTSLGLLPRSALRGQSRRAHPFRAALLGIGAGTCFAYTAAFFVLTSSDLLGPGVAATARDWPGYALAGSTACGIVVEQQAFSLGTLPPAVATMTITNPVIAYVIGIVAFQTPAPRTADAWLGLLGSAVLLAIGVWLLAGSRTAQHSNAKPVAAAQPTKTATG